MIDNEVLNVLFMCIGTISIDGCEFGANKKESDGNTMVADTWYSRRILDGTAGLGPITNMQNRNLKRRRHFQHSSSLLCRHALHLRLHQLPVQDCPNHGLYPEQRKMTFLAMTRLWLIRLMPDNQRLTGWVFKGFRCRQQNNSIDSGIYC